jgi:hypothetical protein
VLIALPIAIPCQQLQRIVPAMQVTTEQSGQKELEWHAQVRINFQYIYCHYTYMHGIIFLAPPPSISGCNVSQRLDTSIDILWITPATCGERKDCYYVIQANDGPPKRHSPVIFRPNNQETFTVGNLLQDTTYQITVSVHNGVSDQDPENVGNRECTIVAATIPGSKYN